MKRIIPIIAAIASIGFLAACNSDDDSKIDLGDYQDWRTQNDDWVAEMQQKKNADGSPFYQTIIPVWNPSAFILMHWFNDRSATAGNLTPLYTSVVDVAYIGFTCEGDTFDSSIGNTKYDIPGTVRFACNGTIQGWAIAMEQMHVGDTCEIIVPYNVGYGSTSTGSLKPYSSMKFNLRLADIYKYEASQY